MKRLWAVVLAVLTTAAVAAAAPPQILQVKIDRGRDTNAWGWVSYHQIVVARVKVGAAGDELGALKVTDPGGQGIYVGTTTSGGSVQVDPTAITRYTFWQHPEADGSITCWLLIQEMPAPPAAGAYKIEISANNKDLTTLFTAAAPAVPEDGPVPIAPGQDAVIDAATPTFQWSSTFPSTSTTLVVREEGNTTFTDPVTDDAGQVWRFDAGTSTQATYNSDGRAARAALMAGRSYRWEIHATRIDDDFVSNPAVQLTTTQTAARQFTLNTTWPALPDLPGKLAYSSQYWGDWSWDFDANTLQLYGKDVASRRWVSPESIDIPNWSADGKKLLYYVNDLGLWIDSLDGTRPTHIPVDVWGYEAWSPDGTQIAYGWVPDGAPFYQIWMMNVDGSNAHPLVQSTTTEAQSPRWSPDASWIAYNVHNGDWSTEQVWLIHPDGTEAHAIEATGVTGYSDWVVGGMSNPSWSPDGQKMAVQFWANSADGSLGIDGIGSIPRDGGPVTPVFLAPAGIACCASPQSPCWSPRGTQIAFVSGHHLPPDPEWRSKKKFEPGDEVWVINADGSGQPTRLTYDFMHNWSLAWWAPPLFPDVLPGNWAFNAVSACQEAGIVTGYPDGYHLLDPVTRDQMAVYIARSIATPTGEAGLQDYLPPSAPSFADVPATYWAYKYIEYAKAQGIVTGYPDGYHPTDPVDRGQMAVYVSRAIAKGDQNVPAATTLTFADAPASFWAYKYVEYAKAQGVVQGYPDGLYHPELVVTRDQMAIYIARAFKLPW